MGLVTSFATALLQHILQNADVAGIGDAGGLLGSVADGNLYVALFTADPTAAGVVTNEAAYTGYARVPVVRTAAGWAVVGTNGSNAIAVTFPECTAGSSTVTHFAICKAGTAGIADILLRGALGASLAISAVANQIPNFAIGELDVNGITT